MAQNRPRGGNYATIEDVPIKWCQNVCSLGGRWGVLQYS